MSVLLMVYFWWLVEKSSELGFPVVEFTPQPSVRFCIQLSNGPAVQSHRSIIRPSQSWHFGITPEFFLLTKA